MVKNRKSPSSPLTRGLQCMKMAKIRSNDLTFFSTRAALIGKVSASIAGSASNMGQVNLKSPATRRRSNDIALTGWKSAFSPKNNALRTRSRLDNHVSNGLA